MPELQHNESLIHPHAKKNQHSDIGDYMLLERVSNLLEVIVIFIIIIINIVLVT